MWRHILIAALAGLGLASTVQARAGAPEVIDCSAQPCRAALPAATEFRPVPGAPYWEGLDAAGDVVGWLALSTDFVDIGAYSGKPLVTLVALRSDGLIGGAAVLYHSEPILLIGIPEQKLHDFVAFYAGKSPLQRVVVGRRADDDSLSVDAVSGATVTVLAQNTTVLETARALGVAVGVFGAEATASGHFVEGPERWTFDQMVERGALGRLVVRESEMESGTGEEAFVDLYFGIVDAPQVGRSLLGDSTYEHMFSRLAPGEHLFVVFNSGRSSFKGSAFVRGGIFDRVRLQQGLREFTFRDTDYDNFPDVFAEGAPEFLEGALFVLRGGQFNPGAAYELLFLGSRYDHRGAFTREYHEFSATNKVPGSLYVVERLAVGIPWREAWILRWLEASVLSVYLLGVLGVFAARRYTTADPERIRRLHSVSLWLGFLVVGVWMGAQPSVTQILTVVGSVIGEWRWDLFLSEPLIFILWIFIAFVSVIWGRGVFCGWVCPYGAMTEVAFKVAERLKIPSFELPDSIHLPLRFLRYGILALLIVVFAWDSLLGEQLAEVEPFKSTFLVPVWTRHWGFVAWWLLLFGISLISYRPFCRYVCPLGGGLALLSSFRPSGPRRRSFCSSCKICTRGCEPRAIRNDGTIDPRECLSCMDCEATYRDASRCPPLLGITRLEVQGVQSERERTKLAALRQEAADV